MTTGIHQNLIPIHDSETQYHLQLHKTELLYRDEEARLFQLRNLNLRDQAANLSDELLLRDERIETLVQQATSLQAQLDTQADSSQSKDGQLKKQAVELATLQAEVDSLNAAVREANTSVQEKFSLARELDRLRPELEHLKSQSADYHQISTERYDLQRRLALVESELENEKSRTQHDHNRVVDARIDDLRSKLEEAERQAIAERRQREKLQAEFEHILTQSRNEATRFDEEVQQLKLKLEEARSELIETQAEFKACRINLRKAEATSRHVQEHRKDQTVIHSPKMKTLASKKVKGASAVQTPGRDGTVKRPMKKRATEQALLGGKSEFSITPFLSRTKSLIDESDDEISRIEEHEPSPRQEKRLPPAHLGVEASGISKSKVTSDPDESMAAEKCPKPHGRLGARPAAKIPSLGKKSAVSSVQAHMARKPRSLAKVIEEEEQKSSDEISGRPAPDLSQTTQKTSLATNVKKKRKLLVGANQSISDDEDGERVAQKTKNPLGPPRGLKAPLKGAISAFSATGAFSPLKRDRRGVNASFLA